MKKSEAIRQAVDIYLCTGQHIHEFCFLTLEATLGRLISQEEKMFIKAEEIKHLPLIQPDRQNIRFMYAEFLALMYEDEEANAQAEVS